MNASIDQALLEPSGIDCLCGKRHHAKVRDIDVRDGAIDDIPELIKRYGASYVYVLQDENTREAAGDRVLKLLRDHNVSYDQHTLTGKIEPDEFSVGSALMYCPLDAEMIITVGTGTLNDVGKIVASQRGLPYMIVGTAPSMDGFASATSSVIRDGFKLSLNSKCPEIVVGDTSVLAEAPMHMIASGLGDMIAKYTSISEWRIANLITGQYYCPVVADMIRRALRCCVEAAPDAFRRDKNAVAAVMNGMILSGIAANFAGCSNPVSGTEHYFSHIRDMRSLEFGTPVDLHGIQCGASTVDVIKAFNIAMNIVPDRKKALDYVLAFDYFSWQKVLRQNLGRSAESMIGNEKKEKKYDKDLHISRLDKILDKYDEIKGICADELPPAAEVAQTLRAVGAPSSCEELGMSTKEIRDAFYMTKDIRDKYILTRLLWDLGEIDEVADRLFSGV